MGIPADDAIETLHLFQAYLFMFAPALFVLAARLGYWMSRRALSPVDELVRTAREIGGTNLSSRLLKLNTGDELQRLSDTLDEMLDRIESAFLRVRNLLPTPPMNCELRSRWFAPRPNSPCAAREPRMSTKSPSDIFCSKRNAPLF
jgi:HAMP domain-containing protein